jgi:SAM-dependent methyltransferase
MTAKIVALPNTGRRFFLEHGYAFGYIALSVAADEERVLGNALRQTIRKHHPGSGALLDIGCADARLTQKIGARFKRVTIYEPNPLLFSLGVSRLSNWGPRVDWRNTTFPEPNVGFSPFDVIIASHVMYHLKLDEWSEFFMSAEKQLAPNGIMIVVLWNKHSEARQLVEIVDRSRWLCGAEDLVGPNPTFVPKEAGLRIVSVTQVAPVIKVFSQSMATTVRNFLLGHAVSSSRDDAAAIDKMEQALLVHGLINSQSIITLTKSSPND